MTIGYATMETPRAMSTFFARNVARFLISWKNQLPNCAMSEMWMAILYKKNNYIIKEFAPNVQNYNTKTG